MDLKLFYTGPMQVNTYLCADEETNKGFIVDPGGPSKPLDNYIKSHGYDIEYIVLTHGHGDHICGVPYYQKMFGCPIAASSKDNYLFDNADENMSASVYRPEDRVHTGCRPEGRRYAQGRKHGA